MRRPMLALVVLVALAVVSGVPEVAHAQKPFKIGAIVPVSGPAAAFGVGVQRGLELAAEDIGVFTVAGEKYRLEVVTYDTVYAPDKTVAAINRAVYNDNVKYGVIIGAGVHPPILPIIRETGFLDFAFAAAGRQITNPENPTAFRIMASSDQLYQTYAVAIAEKLGGKRIAFLGPNDELGKNDAKAIKTEVEKMKGKGVSFVAEEYYERGGKDFGPALLRLIAQKPDIIDTDGSPTGSIALIAKQARELGYTGYFVNTTAVLEAKAISDIAGKAGDNIIALRIWANPPTKLYTELAERHQKKYGEAAPGTLWETYGAARWLVDTIAKTGTFDTKKVADALAASTYPAHPFGAATWGGEKTYGIKRQIVIPIPASILKNGKWEPFDIRSGKFE
ncbi:MAG TPA: ABC transporter substrate-binding protein [Methylomirabilota bacterium]|nr:ABC transporter substrate-binding protein [Methylomirabilota bacterium]